VETSPGHPAFAWHGPGRDARHDPHLTGLDTFGLWQSLPETRFVLPVLGIVFILPGLVLIVATIRLFVTVGQGTLARWSPTQRLVVQGGEVLL
jgi:hypothetical protein